MHFMGLRILRDLSQNIYQIFEPLTSNIEDMTYQEYLIKYRVQSPNKDARDKKQFQRNAQQQYMQTMWCWK